MSVGSPTPSVAQTPAFHGSPGGTLGKPRYPPRPGVPPARCRCRDARSRARTGFWRFPQSGSPWNRERGGRQNTQAALRRRLKRSDNRGQVVDPVQRLDHDPLDPQVVTPHPLDQCGVVHPFDVDPAGLRHPRPLTSDRDRSRGGTTWRRPTRACGRTKVTGDPSSRNAPVRRENTRSRPCLSCSRTESLSHPRTAPQKPLPESSTTSAMLAPTAGVSPRSRRADQTSEPYRPAVTGSSRAWNNRPDRTGSSRNVSGRSSPTRG